MFLEKLVITASSINVYLAPILSQVLVGPTQRKKSKQFLMETTENASPQQHAKQLEL